MIVYSWFGARYQDIDTKNLQKKTAYSEDKVSPSLGIVVETI